MKIITDGVAYVQKSDLFYLNTTGLSVPASILLKTLEVSIDSSDNQYEFVKFERKKEVKYFRDMSCIIDYDQIKDLSIDELITYGQSIVEEKKKLESEYKPMDLKDKINNIDMLKKYKLLDFRMHSLIDAMICKSGKLPMVLPSELSDDKNIKEFFKVKK